MGSEKCKFWCFLVPHWVNCTKFTRLIPTVSPKHQFWSLFTAFSAFNMIKKNDKKNIFLIAILWKTAFYLGNGHISGKKCETFVQNEHQFSFFHHNLNGLIKILTIYIKNCNFIITFCNTKCVCEICVQFHMLFTAFSIKVWAFLWVFSVKFQVDHITSAYHAVSV